MDKYGVDETSTPEKSAGEKRTCPACGALLEDLIVTGVQLCPNCGSKPFEETP